MPQSTAESVFKLAVRLISVTQQLTGVVQRVDGVIMGILLVVDLVY